ncbi:Uncharacterised protein [Vibrio cholerae]|uniref:Uncharacterized protein n=1 Tax=Vibrio cholerae TaxID=666 RepID=A0A656ANV7_VIBCL|nr:Uncharacterised protein [Vibrio cholerae]CSB16597.1 Uncharacterised protein [Vibrio cholerae]CSC38197.1 Uncharacterised protein [Vibrio cholerae]CSD06763.1 Uncharacterised protein [Vibrio cholerae]CSD23618.1 Uncharacterised protein [Vibrio cholerae]
MVGRFGGVCFYLTITELNITFSDNHILLLMQSHVIRSNAFLTLHDNDIPRIGRLLPIDCL